MCPKVIFQGPFSQKLIQFITCQPKFKFCRSRRVLTMHFHAEGKQHKLLDQILSLKSSETFLLQFNFTFTFSFLAI